MSNVLVQYQERVENVLRYFLAQQPVSPLREAMEYSVLNGGKRLRAALVYAVGMVCDCDQTILDYPAAAIEMIHAYSLIHDDLPAMDNDDLRRGKPSCHKAFGEAIAILAGDALQSLAFEILSDENLQINASQKNEMIHVLAKASGARGMAEGQALDILKNNLDHVETLEKMYAAKTGALISAAISLGLIAGDLKDQQINNALETFAKYLGLGYQIIDDILDLESQPEILGKPVQSDLKQNKFTYPKLVGITKAKEKNELLFEQAMEILKNIGFEHSVLSEITLKMMCRKN